LLDAIEFPQRDHSAGLARYLAWAEKESKDEGEGEGERAIYNPLYLTIFGEYRQVKPDPFNNRWMWLKEAAGFRQSNYFKPFVRDRGWLTYWQQNGFPDNCRPQGKEDFECD